MTRAETIPLDQYFAERDPRSRVLFDIVRAVIESMGDVEVRVTKSQVAFRRRAAFAWTWIPEQYLRREGLAPLVLTVDLHRRDESPRWKQIVEARPGRFTHHLELTSAEQVDDQVRAWLREAWVSAE